MTTPQSPAVFTAMTARFEARLKTRILAFGSSNTERFLPGMHWFDVFDLALQNCYGRIHHCINTGIGGHTTRDLLGRFDEDAAFYKPHLVFITIGGNDSNPDRQMTPDEFEANLLELHRRFASWGCAVVFQTYYAPDPARVGAGHLATFRTMMQRVRIAASKTGAGLVDHLARWEALQAKHPDRYLPLMQDGFHLNRRGNKVLGFDLASRFGSAPTSEEAYWKEAKEGTLLMDGALG
ncbi:MAG: SGNH/GDSL hydrolase family protein [Spirochaetes bacterium]|nr:SGNH/GDSL hydrolase family protein [Spirochaetota bacterium]